MNWLARVFVSAILRRLAYAVVALLLVFAGVSRANAQSCSSASEKCSEGQAYAICRSELASYIAGRAPVQFRNDRCEKTFPTSTGSITSKFEYQNQGTWVSGVYRNYYYTRGCSTEPNYTGTGPWASDGSAKNGSIGCRNGCDGAWFSNADSTKTWMGTGAMCPENEKENCERLGGGYFWNSTLNVCEPPEGKCPNGGKPNSLGKCAPEPCPEGMAQQADGTCKKKDEECPAGQIRSPLGSCIPGDNQCAAGEVRGKDGTCKRDKNGDGEPDEGEEEGEGPDGQKVKENFSGGDDCTAPPSCSGSPIMCGMARIQWRIDCNTRKNRNIAGGACGTVPICTGEKCDSMEYSGMLFQWRSACAAEKLLAKSGDSTGGSIGDANKNGVADALEGKGAVNAPGDGKADVAGVKKWGINLSTSVLDTSDMLGGGSCPQPPTIVIMGKSVSGSDMPYFCQLAAILRGLILFFGAYTALRILMGGNI
ncbi:virulence factor TspB C-terminal domain-related protein [Stenotrophomonas sp. HMWF003]|uniref:virulence factor TspB C-terminal domain-related protein n=1 Tax=Stenotrophomonas sp. HMWF003 TaxID=2056840 RepID=UPI000D4F9C3E|nr:virulence factor TspB C-terminal domain-related protein [Stenotrophomonas sp. HMWF003]PTT59853.1 hypothetical protein DBR34_13910 [Stenotrophomonas sp. HMWF003]